jgi:Rha family phage regulatory protein
MDAIPQDLSVFIAREGDTLVTDSRAVALAFSKKHQHVLRTIRAMHVSKHPEIAHHARSNFGQSSYVNAQGKTQPMYRMTAKGLSELAMSFSGDKSRVVRIRFLNAFEEVTARLARAERSLVDQLHALELKEAPSKVKGRIGSKLMNERRVEKKVFAEEGALLLEKLQPSLLTAH